MISLLLNLNPQSNHIQESTKLYMWLIHAHLYFYRALHSRVASLHKVAGHNMGLLIICLDSKGTMEDVHQKITVQPTSPLGTFTKDFMHFVSTVVIIIQIIHF